MWVNLHANLRQSMAEVFLWPIAFEKVVQYMRVNMLKMSALALMTIIYVLLVLPQGVSAGSQCRCQTVGSDYSKGMWVDETGGYCNRGYGTCILNCVAVESDTGRCIQKCFTSDLSCDPLTETVLNVGFEVPTPTQIISNLIRLLFFVAGIVALFRLLLGGFEWVQSGGEDEKVAKAQSSIVASVIGLVVMIAVLSLVIFLEQVVFGGKICLGISCPMNFKFLRLLR
jgi:hypothetical protein